MLDIKWHVSHTCVHLCTCRICVTKVMYMCYMCNDLGEYARMCMWWPWCVCGCRWTWKNWRYLYVSVDVNINLESYTMCCVCMCAYATCPCRVMSVCVCACESVMSVCMCMCMWMCLYVKVSCVDDVCVNGKYQLVTSRCVRSWKKWQGDMSVCVCLTSIRLIHTYVYINNQTQSESIDTAICQVLTAFCIL